MNYATLTQLVVDTIKDSDVGTTQAQSFISTFEQSLPGDMLDTSYGPEIPRQMMARFDGTSTSNADITLPSDFLRSRAVKVNGSPSRYISPEKVETAAPGFGEATVQLDYYKTIPMLSGGSNWVGDSNHAVYLWGSCLQYIPWAHEYENLQAWTGYYMAAVKSLKKANGNKPSGGYMSQKGIPYSSFYTIIDDKMLFTGPVRRGSL